MTNYDLDRLDELARTLTPERARLLDEMPEVIARDVFDKRFAYRIGHDGEPVFRRLREMTADQLWDAVGLYGSLSERWQAAAGVFMTEDDDIEPTNIEDAPMLARRSQQEADLLYKSAKASELYTQLVKAACSVFPPDVDTDTPMLDLLRHHWPSSPGRMTVHTEAAG